MNATLTKQFEGFAECCLELARSAETTERRARFIQMAHEYQLATLLISEELSSDLKDRRLLPAAAGTSPTLPGRVHLANSLGCARAAAAAAVQVHSNSIRSCFSSSVLAWAAQSRASSAYCRN